MPELGVQEIPMSCDITWRSWEKSTCPLISSFRALLPADYAKGLRQRHTQGMSRPMRSDSVTPFPKSVFEVESIPSWWWSLHS